MQLDEKLPLLSHDDAAGSPRAPATAKLLKAGCAIIFATVASAHLRPAKSASSSTTLTGAMRVELPSSAAINATADDAICVLSWGKCGGGIWSEHVGSDCCEPDFSCYWKRGSDVQGCESAYAQVRGAPTRRRGARR